MKYRKKPVVVEAEQWAPYKVSNFLSQANLTPIDSDTDWRCQGCGNRATLHMNCPTLEGWHIVCPGDYIIKGIKGEFYPCKPDVFEATYEPVRRNSMRLIDADKAVEQINEWLHQTRAIPLNTSYHFELLGCIEDCSTIDAVPVVRGEWIQKHHIISLNNMTLTGTYPTCNLCDYAEVGMAKKSNYCPNCGARMDGAE